jgi:hypothetical protein
MSTKSSLVSFVFSPSYIVAQTRQDILWKIGIITRSEQQLEREKNGVQKTLTAKTGFVRKIES